MLTGIEARAGLKVGDLRPECRDRGSAIIIVVEVGL